MDKPLRVVQYGLGPIGQSTVQTVLEKQADGYMNFVGAIDIDPEKVGRDVADLLDEDREPTDVTVRDNAEAVLRESDPDVVLHTTTSFVDGVMDQLVPCAKAGVHVVSSTEELSYPYERSSKRANKLDAVAQEEGVVIVGTGVNPGYAMDTLALMATGVCVDVNALHIERIVDAGERRGPLQDKVGAGLTAEAFAEKKAPGGFGHIGLRESLWMVADGLGWSIDHIEETLDPVTAGRKIDTGHRLVKAGDVAGIHHAATGLVDGQPRLTLNLKMYVGADNPHDAVTVEGDPPIDFVVENGIFGDTATVAMLVNMAPIAMEASPGLQTMSELPVPRAFGTRP